VTSVLILANRVNPTATPAKPQSHPLAGRVDECQTCHGRRTVDGPDVLGADGNCYRSREVCDSCGGSGLEARKLTAVETAYADAAAVRLGFPCLGEVLHVEVDSDGADVRVSVEIMAERDGVVDGDYAAAAIRLMAARGIAANQMANFEAVNHDAVFNAPQGVALFTLFVSSDEAARYFVAEEMSS